jgi:PleD family two-component response regulator
MPKTVLIIDENREYADLLKNKLQSSLDLIVTVIDDYTLIDSTDDISSYSLYYIHLDNRTDKIIKTLLDDDERTVVLLTRNDDLKTRDLIKSYAANDYIILNSSSNGDVACKIANRLINNKSLTVMIIDDSITMLDTLALQLESQNLSYIKCTNGKIAWDYINNPFAPAVDLVISDYMMPIVDGYELTKLIRSKFTIEKLQTYTYTLRH